jgi:hypothetical protein
MSIDNGRLKDYKQLIQEIEDLDNQMKEISMMDDAHILGSVLDIDGSVLSKGSLNDMQEVTQAYRITIAQLISKEIDHKAGFLDKLKLRKDEKS